MDMTLSNLWEISIVEDRGAWCAAVHEVTENHMWISNWTTTTIKAKTIILLENIDKFSWPYISLLNMVAKGKVVKTKIDRQSLKAFVVYNIWKSEKDNYSLGKKKKKLVKSYAL